LKQKLLSVLRVLFFLSIGVFLIWIIVSKLSDQQIAEIKQAFREANYLWALLSIVAGILSHISRAARWNMLLEPMGYRPGLANSFYAVMVGYVSNLAFHRVGEVIRCGVLKKYENVPINRCLGTVILERGIDLVMLIAIFIIVVITQFDRLQHYINDRILAGLEKKFADSAAPGLLTYIIIGAIAVVALLVLLFRKKIASISFYSRLTHLMTGFWTGFKTIRQVKNLPLFIAHSVFIWLMYYMMIYLGFFCLEQTASLPPNAALIILVFASVAIIVVQGGIGAYPLVVAEMLELFAIKYTIGYAYGWIVWSAQTVMIVSVGLLSLVLLSFTKQTQKRNESD